MYQTYQPQKDQSGKTISIVHLSPQYRNNGGGPTNVMFAFRQSADLMTGRSSQSNMSSMSGTLPGYLLRSCRIPHIVNTSLVCIDFLYFSIQALPLTITSRKCALLFAFSTISLVIPLSFHGRRSSWIHRKQSGHTGIEDGSRSLLGLKVLGQFVGQVCVWFPMEQLSGNSIILLVGI